MSVPDPSAVDWVPLYNTAASGIPPAVNGQWLKGVGGAAVWSAITQQDVTLTPYGTTLPASPFNGQEAVLVDSVTNPTWRWRLRYNAQSTSNRKWEFVGGTPLTSVFDTAEALNTGWAAGSPSLTVPRDGEYLFAASGMFIMAGSTLIGLGIWTTGVAGPATHATTQGSYWGLEVNERRIDLAAGAVVSTAYYAAIAGQQAQQRRISCVPIRVG